MRELIYNTYRQQRKKAILMLIQFTVGFFALLYSAVMIDNLLRYKEQLGEIVDLGTMQVLDYTENDLSINDSNIERYIKSIRQLKKEEDIEKLALFQRVIWETSEGDIADGVIAYEDYFSMVEFKLMEGSVEPLKKYSNDEEEIPVLVTEEFAKIYPYNTTFGIQELKGQKCKVAGVIDSKSYYLGGNTIPMSDGVKPCTGSLIFMPSNKECGSIEGYQYNTMIAVNTGDDSESKEIIEKINEIYADNNIFIDVMALKNQVNEYYRGHKPFIITILCFSVILLVLSVLGCIGTILAGILQRKEEFGIYLALGFSRKNLGLLITLELGILFIFSFFIALIACNLLLSQIEFTTNVYFNLRIFLTGFSCMMGCMILSIIPPINKIRKIQPVELIEERE
ncbi:MAG: ABC transporter permease [Lachnospiraceae bacterium]